MMPALSSTNREFAKMSKYIVDGLSCFDPLDTYGEIIFMVKRLVGVPGYYYLESEVPQNFNRNDLVLYQLSYVDRFFIWLSVITRQFMLKFFVIRWFFNTFVKLFEFIMQNFPIIAFFKFGLKDSYVTDKWN